MKNNLCKLLSFLFIIGISMSSYSQKNQKPFQGKITYDISYSGANITPELKSQMQLPSSEVVSIKDCQTRTETSVGPVSQVTITNGSDKTLILLIDFMGTKYAIKRNAEDIAKDSNKTPTPTLNITNETKQIAGYTCKKAILTTKQDDGTTQNDTVFFTKEIGNSKILLFNSLVICKIEIIK